MSEERELLKQARGRLKEWHGLLEGVTTMIQRIDAFLNNAAADRVADGVAAIPSADEVTAKEQSIASPNAGQPSTANQPSAPSPDSVGPGGDCPAPNEPKEILASRLIDAWCADKGKQIPWAKAVQIVAVVTGLSDEEKSRLLRMGDEDGSCGMCGRRDCDRPAPDPLAEIAAMGLPEEPMDQVITVASTGIAYVPLSYAEALRSTAEAMQRKAKEDKGESRPAV